MAASTEGVFEGVGEKFIDDESDRKRRVHGRGSMIHFLVQANSVRGAGVHDGGCNLAQIMSEIDFVRGPICGKGLI